MKVRTTRNGIVAGLVVVFAALMFVSDIHAQPRSGSRDGRFMGGGPRGMLPGLREMDLTDAQREAIQAIAEQNRSEGRAMAEQLGAARASLNEAVMADVVNESTIRARAADLARLEADAAVQRAYVNADIWQILTPDQRVELRQLQAEAEERRGERMSERRERRRGRR